MKTQILTLISEAYCQYNYQDWGATIPTKMKQFLFNHSCVYCDSLLFIACLHKDYATLSCAKILFFLSKRSLSLSHFVSLQIGYKLVNKIAPLFQPGWRKFFERVVKSLLDQLI